MSAENVIGVSQFAEFSSAVVRCLPRDILPAQAQKWIEDQAGLQERLRTALIVEMTAHNLAYFLPLSDSQVPPIHHPTILKYRSEATRQGIPVTTPLCYRVSAGFTLKTHAPQAGSCRENFQYLQNWDFTDDPTPDCLVFWIPRLVPGSTGKNVDEQKIHLIDFRNRLDLPSHHCSSFGSVALTAGLILAHYKATGEQVPLNDLWTRTDSCSSGGDRLNLSWYSGELDCGNWYWDDGRHDSIGCFALGVETALGS